WRSLIPSPFLRGVLVLCAGERPGGLGHCPGPEIDAGLELSGLAVWRSHGHRIESFGEGELLFVDADAIRYNQVLHAGAVAGAVLTCLGAALALTGACLWLLPRVKLPV
ncbi:hypothetical protein NHX12_023274, partial [Muraenolepis orangiensis]